ncbi:glycosyl hydrolase [Roseimarinus sediminis]|uniref:glycosyl hydrolase n=1 Tax=Roseimarinus sediminis TaxID=1610899 RepID=UPI003D1B26BC
MRKRIVLLIVIFMSCLLAGLELEAKVELEKLEAENGQLTGVHIETKHKGYSGSGYVSGFDNEGDRLELSFESENEGKQRLMIGYSGPYGDKNNRVYFNGENLGDLLFPASAGFTEIDAGTVMLKKGSNSIVIEKSWGWFEVDYFRLADPEPPVSWNISEHPVNQAASAETRKLYDFLLDHFGKQSLAGQYVGGSKSYNDFSSEWQYLHRQTGKYPALYGNDLMDYSPSRVEFGAKSTVTDDVIRFYNDQHGLVTLSWHWNAPTDLPNTEEQPWWSGFYTRATTFDLAAAINDPESERYQLLLRDMDVIAAQLKRLQDKKIPVLWRPLHEAEGAWFWWGAKGPEACVKLWQLMYERFTVHHQLNNLLWVWTTTDSPNALDWYPGDDYVDILGVDVYLNNGDYSASASMFDRLRQLFEGKKMLTMSENGTIPDPGEMYSKEAPWLYFCTWSGDFIFDGERNSNEHLKEVFQHDSIMTLDELPDKWYQPDSTSSSKATGHATRIYPVPFQQTLHFNFSETPLWLTISDSSGRTLIERKQSELLPNTSLSMHSHPPGIYLVSYGYETAVHTLKTLKKQ